MATNTITPGNDARRATRNLMLVIEEFRKLDPEMQAQTIMTFIMVADKPGIDMKTMQERLGVARSTMSRNVTYLSNITYKPGRTGHGLVESREDPTDRRSKQVFLTAKGRRFYTSILYHLGVEE